MKTYAFEIVLEQAQLSDEECDRLYEGGADDATIVTREGVTRLAFDREAESLEEAIRTATAATESAGFPVTRIELQAPERSVA